MNQSQLWFFCHCFVDWKSGIELISISWFSVMRHSLQALKPFGMFTHKWCCPTYERFARKTLQFIKTWGLHLPAPPALRPQTFVPCAC